MSESASTAAPGPRGKALAGLTFAALGVVFGDIGTSPLYALEECFTGTHGTTPTPENVLGVLSLVFWSLNFLITFKYLTEMMKVDNRGEGGVMALLSLLRPNEIGSWGRWALISAGLFGTALLYGDGVITPAITVLSAVEGLQDATPALAPFVLWITIAIILALFLVQKRGTAGVGAIFGPVTLVWFASIALLGVRGILLEPMVLRALNPWHAVDFFLRNGPGAITILAAVVLVLTGGEALYADMGHFGRRPIRRAWAFVVLPALVLNYFGQGALILTDPTTAGSPFYALVPRWALWPMIGLATVAAAMASQALISGAFSLTQQAVQLGYCPRVTIVHTSSSERGQIYIPEVNWALMIACIGLVLGFKNSSNLAGTYGMAVCGTMTITTILFGAVARERLRWSLVRVAGIAGLILSVDLAFFGANLTKFRHGGWFPLVLAAIIFVLMTTWKKGRRIVTAVLREGTLPMELFIKDIGRRPPVRVPGVAVFMTSDLSGAPPVLLHHLKHNKVLHEKVVLMSISTREIPLVPGEERLDFEDLGHGVYAVHASYGFMETPNVPHILHALAPLGVSAKVAETTFYLGRETLIPTRAARPRRVALAAKGLWMALWRKRIFMVMSNNARSATAFFGLPPNRVVELGAQVQI